MKRVWQYALLLSLIAAPLAAQRPGAGRPGDRRGQLEQQLLTRFVQRAATELELDERREEQLRQAVRVSAQERREIHRASADLRRRLAVAVEGGSATDADFERLLTEHRTLRAREHALADAEEQRLAFLTPRQRAQYMLLWIRLQDDARAVMMQRPPHGPPPR